MNETWAGIVGEYGLLGAVFYLAGMVAVLFAILGVPVALVWVLGQ
jgi:hypothetical protein